MRTRTFGLALLVLVGVLPLAIFGVLAIYQSQSTAVAEVRSGNDELARVIAERVGAYKTSEREILNTIGVALVQARDPASQKRIWAAYEVGLRRIDNLAVYDANGEWIAGSRLQTVDAVHQRLLRRALAGQEGTSEVQESESATGGLSAYMITIGEPIRIAGKLRGAVVADSDLLGLWEPINSVHVGSTGFVRLIAKDGSLLAHGNPEERRYVLDDNQAKNLELVVAAEQRRLIENQQGHSIVVSTARVPGSDWRVLVEQSVKEAFGTARALKRNLVILVVVALVVAVAIGLVAGRVLVRGFEQLHAHTRELAKGDLSAKAEPKTSLVEVRTLAEAFNDMSSSLQALHEEARERERLTSFARVAAGLSHDLRAPIETVRSAFDALLDMPEDPDTLALIKKVAGRDLPRLTRHFDDLQRLARRGDIEAKFELVDPGDLAKEVVQDMVGIPKWEGIEFRATGSVTPMHLDAHLIRRAIYNLASNGADACAAARRCQTGTGKDRNFRVSIDVSNGHTDGRVQIRVEDTGVGMDATECATVLRSDLQSTKHITGVGLGLSVVRQVVDAHKGTIEVHSEPGRGSTFTVSLPRDPPQIINQQGTR